MNPKIFRFNPLQSCINFRDVAVIYPNGYGQIVGRIKDMVIRGGENLFPREIEEVHICHPNIIEAYVTGVPDERFGEELCAWIKLDDKAKDHLTEQKIRDFCKESLAHFKIPRHVLFVDEFPTTVTGKVQKNVMRDLSLGRLGLGNKE